MDRERLHPHVPGQMKFVGNDSPLFTESPVSARPPIQPLVSASELLSGVEKMVADLEIDAAAKHSDWWHLHNEWEGHRSAMQKIESTLDYAQKAKHASEKALANMREMRDSIAVTVVDLS